jgi:signal transduction histidine kinase
MMRLGITARLGLIVVVAIAVAWIGALTLFFVSQPRALSRPLPTQIVAIVELLEKTPAEGQQTVLDAVTSPTLFARLEAGVHVGPGTLRPLLRLGERALERELGGRPLSLQRASDERRVRGPFASADLVELRVGLATNQTLVLVTQSALFGTFFGLPLGFGAGLFGTLVALVAVVVLVRETRPLTRLAADVDRIDPAAGDVHVVADRGAPEIRLLVDAFNRLQTRVADLLRARMAMMGGISHDVRTFATRLRLRVDAIDDSVQRERAIGDIDDMIRLLDDGLLASRAGAGELAHELIDVDACVRAEVGDRIASGAPIALAIADGAYPLLGDRLALRRIVGNLVDNALRFGRHADVALAREGAAIVLTVDDDGPGIPVDRRACLLEPFTRLESSRNRATGGAGLGLAIVRNLAVALGGTVAIGDAPRGGARLLVELPAFVAGSTA